MGFSDSVHSVIWLHAGLLEPAFHVELGSDEACLRLTTYEVGGVVYLDGTRDELLDFVARLVAVIPALECHPDAGQHVEPHTCGIRAPGDGRPLSLGECLTESAVAELARERDDDNDERRLGTHTCEGCGQTMIHDCARYWFCANESCPRLRHAILIRDDGSRSRVGTIR